ncbi:hypothetical protein BGZ75_001995, partial [Mortierella antarctica]
PFYEFTPTFFERVDKVTKALLWNNSGTAWVSLAWCQRPKSQGGWNLINPKNQCKALRA